MISLALALSLFAQGADAAPAPAEAAPPEERLPAGAPKDDYQFVAWCYGSLRAYLDLHDQVMPEVTRIEGEFRKPGTRLEDDLKVYAEMQKEGRARLKQFQAAMTAAEKASVRPINMVGAQAVRKGKDTWSVGADVTKARLAQEWMSWVLPARCEKVASSLEARSKLMGVTLKANAPAEPAPEAPAEKPAETPAAGSDPTTNPTAAPPESPPAPTR
ncbi:MAG: hypothetical protein JF588_12255 [Caulobacterales bacterium]|nr:hypothetical protein [Caulobacterales bacterium]